MTAYRPPSTLHADATRLPRMTSGGSAPGLYRNFGKRMLDLSLIALFSVPALLIVLVFALAVMLDGGAPFYRQERIGRNGRRFRILKLRSMVPDADRKLATYLETNPDAKSEWEVKQKLRHDPRVTRTGRIIRKTSLDELPQLWNVIRGDMSLVGPRPMMVDQAPLYPGTAYYDLRPGITGYWQISARNGSSFAQRARFDTLYHRDLSLKTDFGVLMRSIGVVAKATGC